jgi:hypothetical protein
MTGLVLEPPVRYWKCPSCLLVDRTQRSDVHTQFHNCPALGNVAIPLIEVSDPDAKPQGRHVVVQREDYAGSSDPTAAISTERPDGSNDITVLAETATVTIK